MCIRDRADKTHIYRNGGAVLPHRTCRNGYDVLRLGMVQRRCAEGGADEVFDNGIAPMLFLICISSAIRGYFQGFQQMMPTAVSELIEAFCKLAVGIALAAYAADRYPGQYHIIAAYAAIGLTVGAGLSMIFLVVSKLLFNESRYTKEFLDKCGGENTDSDPSGKIIKRLITIALPITISSSIMSLTGMIDSILVQRLLQQGSLITKAMTQKEATTVYGNYTSRAVPMFNLPPVLVYPISCSIVPLISAARGQGDTKRVGTIMESSLRTAVLIGAPCALGMTVLARPILSLFFTGDVYKRQLLYHNVC